MTLRRLATLRRTSTPTRCAAAGRSASRGSRFGRFVPNECLIVAPFLSVLAVASDPAAGEVEVLAAEASKLGGSEPGLHLQREQRVVMPPDRGGAVERGAPDSPAPPKPRSKRADVTDRPGPGGNAAEWA
jgi:hypothetical protein